MPNANQVTLVGHLTRDPELSFTPKGVAVAKFGIAVNEKRGETEIANFFDVTCWYGVAEEASAQLRKGDCAICVGTLRFESWDDKATGQKRSKVSVNASVVGVALWRSDKKQERPAPQRSAPVPESMQQDDGERIPF
jgi:single-strand DNA-binding protein